MKNNVLIKYNLCLLIVSLVFACQQANKGKTQKSEVKSITDAAKISQDTLSIKQPDTLIVSDSKLAELIKETENFFERYDTIRQSETYAISQLKLNQKLRSQLTTVEKDSVDGFEVYEVLQDFIDKNIRKILVWKGIEQYDLSLLLPKYIGIAKSPDGKLYSLSFDEKTGGTYRSSISYIYYIRDKGAPLLLDTVSNSEDEIIFNRDGYGSIDTINTKEGIKYLLIGSVTGCTTCIGDYIDLIHYKKGKVIKDFNYNLNTRVGNVNKLMYDQKQHKIYISYYMDDLTSGCNCGTYGSSNPDDEYEENKLKRVDCIYYFNGKSFKLSKKKITPIKTKP